MKKTIFGLLLFALVLAAGFLSPAIPIHAEETEETMTSTSSLYDDQISIYLNESLFSSYKASSAASKYLIPGIEYTHVGDDLCEDMVPQGFCVTPDYALITAYCHDGSHDSVLYVLDKDSGEYKVTIGLDGLQCHVGAVAYNSSTNRIYVANSSKKRVEMFSCSDLQEAVQAKCRPVDHILTSNTRKLISNADRSLFSTFSVSEARAKVLDSEEETLNTEVIAEGECGDFLTYVLYGDGTLELSGQGAMADYEEDSAPWEDYKSEIREITVDADVTSIGAYAFYGCANLESVDFSELFGEETSFSIGAYAFAGCGSLESLSLPEMAYTIDDTAFDDQEILFESDAEDIAAFCAENASYSLHEHEFSFQETVAATCVNYGYDLYVCSCGQEEARNMTENRTSILSPKFPERTPPRM